MLYELLSGSGSNYGRTTLNLLHARLTGLTTVCGGFISNYVPRFGNWIPGLNKVPVQLPV